MTKPADPAFGAQDTRMGSPNIYIHTQPFAFKALISLNFGKYGLKIMKRYFSRKSTPCGIFHKSVPELSEIMVG